MDEETKRLEQQQALARIQQGLATKVRILVAQDGCPVCQHYAGGYPLDAVPELPLEGCSRADGCNAVYAPVLDMFGP